MAFFLLLAGNNLNRNQKLCCNENCLDVITQFQVSLEVNRALKCIWCSKSQQTTRLAENLDRSRMWIKGCITGERALHKPRLGLTVTQTPENLNSIPGLNCRWSCFLQPAARMATHSHYGSLYGRRGPATVTLKIGVTTNHIKAL